MALIIRDRCQESFTVPSGATAAFSLGGAIPNFRTFASVMATGDQTRYAATDDVGLAWEIGVGTYNASANTLTRSPIASSNGNGLVAFAGNNGSKIFITLDSAYIATIVPSIVNALVFG